MGERESFQAANVTRISSFLNEKELLER